MDGNSNKQALSLSQKIDEKSDNLEHHTPVIKNNSDVFQNNRKIVSYSYKKNNNFSDIINNSLI